MATSSTDDALMLAVRNGDLGKLAILFERHHVALFTFFRRMTGNRSASEDLVQDVFFRILKYRGTYREDSRFTSWMYNIARNARFDYFRKHRAESSIPEDMDLPADLRVPGEQLERDQEVAMLERALLMLPDDKRELLILARYQEMKYEHIAESLGIDVGAVKVRVHRAVNELRHTFMTISRETFSCNAKRPENSLRII
jgi:RNA polymerase sigma-70 factor (ECF subfamily)